MTFENGQNVNMQWLGKGFKSERLWPAQHSGAQRMDDGDHWITHELVHYRYSLIHSQTDDFTSSLTPQGKESQHLLNAYGMPDTVLRAFVSMWSHLFVFTNLQSE